MNKKEAAKFLGKSIRALERYTTQGKLSVKYKPGKTGQEAFYDKQELRRLKEELARPAYRPAIASSSDNNALSPVVISGLTKVGDRLSEALEVLKPSERATVSVADKLTLTLKETSALSGLSRSWLLEAIHQRKLKAAKRGRGWNIKRSDLEDYVRKL